MPSTNCLVRERGAGETVRLQMKGKDQGKESGKGIEA